MINNIYRRQEELEAKLVEEETAKRVEEMVAKRVAEELKKRKDEIEAEVLRRVEEAKRVMEQQMLEEMERKKKEQEEEERRKKVYSRRKRCLPVKRQSILRASLSCLYGWWQADVWVFGRQLMLAVFVNVW